MADNWPNWRGPGHNGVATGENYPTKWSTTENVLWKVALPGKGASTPVVWGDKIFLTYGSDKKNTAVCLDRSGKQLWSVAIGTEKEGKHKKATGSNSSPVTDGTHVFVYFKSGDLACLDFSGKVVWEKNLQKLYGEDTLWWDLGTSPVLTKTGVVVAVMQSEPSPSYLVSFEKATGKELWMQKRNVPAPSEAAQSYSTPVVLDDGKQEILVTVGADHVTAHEGASGKELWRVGGLNPTQNGFFRSIASAVIADGIVIAPYARGATITGIKLGGSGDVTQTHVLWTRQKLGADVPTPASVKDKVYLCTDKGELHCLNAKTGESIWSGQAEKKNAAFSASPVVAGNKVYLTREDGKTFVHELGSEFKVLGENELKGEYVVATPVFVDGQILIRTLENLYCIGTK
jgi:outer membrane protein assembly factor BamB